MSKYLDQQLNARAKLPDADPWVRILGRVGLAAKGVVYIIVGILALRFAIGAGGEITSARGALREIGQQPFGQTLLVIMGIGLLAYAVYRVVAAWKDIDAKGTDGKGIAGRVAMAVSGIVYGSLGIAALGLVGLAGGGGGGGGGQSGQEQMTAELMSQPFGRWAVGIVGVIIFGYGLLQGQKAIKRKFMRKFKTSEMSHKEIQIVDRSGMAGLLARGVVFLLTGWFFLMAAWNYNASESKGLEESLAYIASRPYGMWLLGLVALGLFLYGVYSLFLARYRHFAKSVNPGGAKPATGSQPAHA